MGRGRVRGRAWLRGRSRVRKIFVDVTSLLKIGGDLSNGPIFTVSRIVLHTKVTIRHQCLIKSHYIGKGPNT